ncbi:MAG TPA: carbohydrate ABC transporter permease [Ruminiclostridium sp.]
MKVKLSKGERVFETFNIILLVFLCLIMIYPITFVIGRSFMEETYLSMHPLAIIPQKFSLEGYAFVFNKDSYILNSYVVTIGRTIIGTLASLFFTAMLAYTLSKKNYPGRSVMTLIIVFTMWFSGGLIPYFLLIRSLGLINKFAVYIIPNLISAWNLILLRNFFMSIPIELEESAKIDGANDLGIFFKIYLPLSSAALATIGLFYAVDNWNAWFDSLMFVNNRKLWTLQLMLQQIISSTNVNSLVSPSAVLQQQIPMEIVKYACIVVATVPILCVYPFLQKYFVKGIMVGSLKG